MKKEETDAEIILQEKICNFQDAIHDCKELRGLCRFGNQDGYNDYDDRYWTAVFHKIKPDHTLNKQTRLSYGFGGSSYSSVFLYDHQTGKRLNIGSDKDNLPVGCFFAQFFESKNILMKQFYGRLLLYKINPDTLEVDEISDSKKMSNDITHFNKPIKKVVLEKSGLDYFVYYSEDNHPKLVKFDWDANKLIVDSLPGYMTRFGSVDNLFVKELKQPIVILCVHGQQKVDPDPGYALYLPYCGKDEEDFKMYHFKNEFFQSNSPDNFIFHEPDESGFIQIDIYSDKLLLSKTIVPIYVDFDKKTK